MITQSKIIGLDPGKAIDLSNALNNLLADYHIYYQNLRGFHWNIRGKHFFQLHAKFEELYNDALVKIDEIAERILTLGAIPCHSFSEYISRSEIKEAKDISEGTKAIEIILQNISILLNKERMILNLSDEANDEGTNSLMSDYLKEQEKTAWMLGAWLNG
jgi:starvation-inducible DNA-binding protein